MPGAPTHQQADRTIANQRKPRDSDTGVTHADEDWQRSALRRDHREQKNTMKKNPVHPKSDRKDPMPTVTFRHITMETGHDITQNAFCPIPAAVAPLRAFTADGFHEIPFGCSLLVSRYSPDHVVFSVFNEMAPLLHCHACLDADASNQVWTTVNDILRHLYREGPCAPALNAAFPGWERMLEIEKPTDLFLAVSLSPFLQFDLGAAFWLGDFERCLYWALWEQRQAEKRKGSSDMVA